MALPLRFISMTLPEVSLAAQAVVLVFLVVSVLLVKRGLVKQHAWAMLAVFLIHSISVLAVMVPFSIILFSQLSGWFLLIAGIHIVLGVVVFLYGVYFFYSWGFKTPSPSCFLNKSMMRGVAALWIVEVLIGALMHWVIY